MAKVYRELFSRWPEAGSLAGANVEEVRQVIRPLGLTSRAELLVSMAGQVSERGGVPSSLEEMMRLSGVGRYAASATLSSVFDTRHPVVDGTSARVYRRVFSVLAAKDSQVDDELWALVEEASPKQATAEWNWAVLDLAATICLPKVPRCLECPLREVCLTGRRRTHDLSQAPA